MLTVPVSDIMNNMAYAIGETPNSVMSDMNSVNRYISCINRARWEIYSELGLWSENYFNTFVTDNRVTDFSPTPTTSNLLPHTSTLSGGILAGGVALTPSFFHSFDNTFNLCKVTGTGTLTFEVTGLAIGWYTFSFFARAEEEQTISVAVNSETEDFTVSSLQRRKLSVFNETAGGTVTCVITKGTDTTLQFGEVQLESGVMATEYLRNTTAAALTATTNVGTDRIDYISLYSPDVLSNVPVVHGVSPMPYARSSFNIPIGFGIGIKDGLISLQNVPTGTTYCYSAKSQPKAIVASTETLQTETQDLAIIISGAVYYLTESTDAGEMSQRAAILHSAFREAIARRQTYFAPTKLSYIRNGWS